MSVLDDEKFKHPSGSYEAVARVPTPCWVRLAAYTQDPVLPRQPVPVPVAMIPSWSPNYSQCTGAKHWQVEAQRAALLCTKVYVSSSLGVRCLLRALWCSCGRGGLGRRRAVSVCTEMSGVRRVSTFNRMRERVCTLGVRFEVAISRDDASMRMPGRDWGTLSPPPQYLLMLPFTVCCFTPALQSRPLSLLVSELKSHRMQVKRTATSKQVRVCSTWEVPWYSSIRLSRS